MLPGGEDSFQTLVLENWRIAVTGCSGLTIGRLNNNGRKDAGFNPEHWRGSGGRGVGRIQPSKADDAVLGVLDTVPMVGRDHLQGDNRQQGGRQNPPAGSGKGPAKNGERTHWAAASAFCMASSMAIIFSCTLCTAFRGRTITLNSTILSLSMVMMSTPLTSMLSMRH